MQGTIVKIVAADGQQVSAGDTVVVLEAMKMEQPLTAHKDGTVATWKSRSARRCRRAASSASSAD